MHRRVRIALGTFAVLAWLGVVGMLAAFSEGYIPRTARQLLLAAFVIGPLLVFAEAIVEAIFHVVAYGAGRALLPIITLGRWRAETFSEDLSFPWHGIRRLPDGTGVLSHDATSIFGLMTILALGAAVLCYAYL